MEKKIYSIFDIITVKKEPYYDAKGKIYKLYLNGEFITDYQTKVPNDIKKFDYEIIDYFEKILR